MTNSVAKDGQTPMTGPMRHANGSAVAPAMTFAADTSTGFFRKSASVIGVAAGGVEVGTLAVNAGGGRFDAFPSGTAMLFAQSAAPTGWTKSTTHNNKALRVVSGTAASGGSTAFTDVFKARTISQANLPNVTFTGTAASAGSHAHTQTVTATPGQSGPGPGGGYFIYAMNTLQDQTSSAGAHTHDVSVSSGGSGTAMDFDVQYVDVIIATKD